jgi:glyoxylase-like metal-dependent hydrolase (beta-lactamase superfamily II)
MKFAKVKVLIKGYVKKLEKNRSEYTCTTTLVQDGKLNIIADPGCPKSEIVLKKALKRFGLNFEDIDIVFITHWHLDHSKLVALFPRAKIVDFWEINRGDKHYFHGGKYKITKNVEVIPTPGHSRGHASLKVNTADGIVVIAGDVFWFSNFTPKKDPYASDQKKLEESRRKILKIANYIIPGHGNIVRVEK